MLAVVGLQVILKIVKDREYNSDNQYKVICGGGTCIGLAC